jgi:ABC-type histidine transport system ATPase subunit
MNDNQTALTVEDLYKSFGAIKVPTGVSMSARLQQ